MEDTPDWFIQIPLMLSGKSLVSVFVITLLIIIFYTVDLTFLKRQITQVIAWTQTLGHVAPLVMFLLHSTAVIICFPFTVLFELGAGLLFGVFYGTLLVLLSKTVGNAIGFLTARYFLRDWIWKKISHHEIVKRIYENVGKDSWKFVLFLRLSPAPSWACTYGLGVTSIPFIPFIVMSVFGSVPMIVHNVYLGSVVQSVAMIENTSSGVWKIISLILVFDQHYKSF